MEARHNSHGAQFNDCRSLGSNVHSSSQSRKISIGIMADSKVSTRCGGGAMNGDEAVMPNTERVTSNVGNFIRENSKAEGVSSSSKMEQIGGPKAVDCSWMSKSFYQRTPTSETILQTNQTSNLLISPGGPDEPNGIGFAAGKQSVQFFSYQTSNFPSDNYNKFDADTSRSCRWKGRKDGSAEEKVEEFTFTTAPAVFESDETKVEDKINRTENRTENLRMKLCQILGTTSSPKTLHSGSHTRNMDEESSPLEQHVNLKDDKIVKSINSDTIESDSEKPNRACKRAATRSRSRKKASTQKQRGKGKSGPISKEADKHQEKSILSFEEKRIGDRDVSSVSLMKKSQGKNCRTGRHKICFNENYTTDKLQQDTLKIDPPKIDPPLHVEASFSLGTKMGGFMTFLPDYQTKSPEKQKIDQENEFYQPPSVDNTDRRGELEVSENGNQQEDPVTQNGSRSQDGFQSPTFQFNTPILRSPSPTPKTNKKANDVNSPSSTERAQFSLRTIRSLRAFEALEPDFNRPREQQLSSHMEGLKHSVPRKEKSFVQEKKDQDGSSDSSSEKRNFQRSHQDSRARHTAERKIFMLHPIKRLRNHKGIKFNDRSPASESSKEMIRIGESDWIDEASEHNQDGFVRAVEMFALELGKLKSKLKLVISQKTSEILKSVAEDIHFQLQDVNSQIQTDLGKLTNISKSKRKRLETRFEDQQKQLRLIYDRFKAEVNLHLQECRSTVKDLEADQIEINGALEKQRVAHKKLLSQVEEAVDIQLDDAQRKITATQEMARGKLLQLKHAMTLCLKEGI